MTTLELRQFEVRLFLRVHFINVATLRPEITISLGSSGNEIICGKKLLLDETTV